MVSSSHRAKAAWSSARRAFGRLEYATSRVSACLIEYSRSPSSDDPGRRRMKSRSSSTRRSGSASGTSSYTGPAQKIRPITDAAWSACFSGASRRSTRAATTAWTVSRIAKSSGSGANATIRSVAQAALGRSTCPGAPRRRTGSRPPDAPRFPVARPGGSRRAAHPSSSPRPRPRAPPARCVVPGTRSPPGRSSRSSCRAVAISSCGPSRRGRALEQVEECSSAQCRSSISSTSGRSGDLLQESGPRVLEAIAGRKGMRPVGHVDPERRAEDIPRPRRSSTTDGWIASSSPEVLLQDLGQRPVRDPLAVGQAP